jgi:hypothetical protein
MEPRMYDYIRQHYGKNPIVGQRVRHTETQREGVVAPEAASAAHYVQVQFDGYDGARPCHPLALADVTPDPDFQNT